MQFHMLEANLNINIHACNPENVELLALYCAKWNVAKTVHIATFGSRTKFAIQELFWVEYSKEYNIVYQQ
jgi:hypothetical protein